MKSPLFAAVTVLCASVALADLPELSYIYPAGGQRGTTVQYRLGGLYLQPACKLGMIGHGLKTTAELKPTQTIWFEGPLLPLGASQQQEDYPKDLTGGVAIAADAPLGVHYWRASTSQGVAPLKKFIVGDLPEIVEQEFEGDPLPVSVRLPVTINGRIFPREDVDVWSFTAKAGQTVRCEVMAARLGSPLDSQLEILDANGRRLAENGDGRGSDSYLEFTAPADGTYQARIYDITFGGLQDYVYRLTLSSEPHVTHVYPRGGRRGSKAKFEVTGVGLPSANIELDVPKDASAIYQPQFNVGGKLTNPVLLDTSDLDEYHEREPNDEATQASPRVVPAVFNGRIGKPGDVDHWAIEAKKGDAYDVNLLASRLGSPLDSVLVVVDATGKELARNDDIANDQPDSQLRFVAPADGTFYLRIEERLRSRGGPDFAYRLRVERDAGPDFRISLVVDPRNPASVGTHTLYRDATANLRLNVARSAGFADEIELAVDNLPPGVTITGNKVGKNANQAQLTFKADATAPIRLYDLTIRGVAKIAGKEVEHVVTAPVAPGEPPIEKLSLAVSMPTPFKVVGVFETKFAPRGSTQTRHYRLERNGYDGPLEIRLADKQSRHLQGVVGAPVIVPSGVDEFDFPIYMPPWMDLSRTSRTCVMASAVIDDGAGGVGSSRVDLQACKLEYSIVSPK